MSKKIKYILFNKLKNYINNNKKICENLTKNLSIYVNICHIFKYMSLYVIIFIILDEPPIEHWV